MGGVGPFKEGVLTSTIEVWAGEDKVWNIFGTIHCAHRAFGGGIGGELVTKVVKSVSTR